MPAAAAAAEQVPGTIRTGPRSAIPHDDATRTYFRSIWKRHASSRMRHAKLFWINKCCARHAVWIHNRHARHAIWISKRHARLS
eukprot:733689-Amphidinium_carterae.1